MIKNGAFSHKIDYVKNFSDGDFAEWVDFAYWWSCIGKGLRLHPAQQACFIGHIFGFLKKRGRHNRKRLSSLDKSSI